jgi:ubiquinone biosynthesis monooxygenase Coq7
MFILGLYIARSFTGKFMASKFDTFVTLFDQALRAITGVAFESRANPAHHIVEEHLLDDKERRHSAGLMRVNHVGEVCAQALYQSQGFFSKNSKLKQQFAEAAKEEEDHLAWTATRLKELGSHVSVLNPFWYAGAFALGAIAAKMGDAHSLGFVMETEKQVEAHLDGHLSTLPMNDIKSRAIVEQMREDEIKHGVAARAAGAADLPFPIKKLMAAMAKVMTTVAYRI